MNEITPLGKELRKLRIDLGVNMSHMAKKIGYSTSMLSAIEVDQRSIPDNFVEKLMTAYPSLIVNRKKFEELVVLQNGTVKLPVKETNVDLVAALARKFESSSEDTSFFEDLRKLLNQ